MYAYLFYTEGKYDIPNNNMDTGGENLDNNTRAVFKKVPLFI